MQVIRVLLLCQAFLPLVLAKSQHPNVEDGFCTRMMPVHGDARPSNGVRVVYANASYCYQPGKPLPIRITEVWNGPTQISIKGLLMIFKKPNNPANSYGLFSDFSPSTLSTSECFGNNHSVLHHETTTTTSSVSFTWTPPTTLRGSVALTMTLVQSYNVFFVNVKKTIPPCVRVPTDPPTTRGTAHTTLATPFPLFIAAITCFYYLLSSTFHAADCPL